MAVGCNASVTLDDMCGLPRRQRHRELPDVVSTDVVATRCAPALPELAIATSGSLDFSSDVLFGKDLA